MKVFAIGDLHLEGGTGKTMDRFGDNWRDHDRKIFEAWDQMGSEDDLLLLVGDLSWAMRIEEAMPDLDRIGNLKGRKIILKGNHDYWWQSVSKMKRVLSPSIEILYASSVVVNRIAIVGTRGWVCPNDSYFEEHDQKIYDREVGRLGQALKSLSRHREDYDKLIVALHYPPTNQKHETSGFTELIDEYGADVCVYGHMHGEDIKNGLVGLRGSTHYYLVSADAVDFRPVQIDLDTARRHQ